MCRSLFVTFFCLLINFIVVQSNKNNLLDVEDRCTTIAVGPGAGKDGPMATHTSDCLNCDFRINKVPARDWPKGNN